MKSIVVLFAIALCSVVAQPGGGTTSGQTTDNSCTITSGNCAVDGSSNYVARSLTYDTSTGKFTGSIITNQCSNDRYGITSDGSQTNPSHTASCIKQVFPAPAYTTTPIAAPLRNRMGLSIKGGVNIFGPLEAGFSLGQACKNNLGSCDAGMDLGVCQEILKYQCGSTNVRYNMLLDTCGGHASPYHYHTDLACDYDSTSTSSHSPLVGVVLDGRGLYGLYEGSGNKPTDLDACNGHYGNVPAYTIGGVTYPAATNVYHYHTTSESPYTVGCFGPVSSLAACKSLYSTCSTGFSYSVTNSGCVNYDTDCPCYHQGTETYNRLSTATCTAGTTTGTTGTGGGTILPFGSSATFAPEMLVVFFLSIAALFVF